MRFDDSSVLSDDISYHNEWTGMACTKYDVRLCPMHRESEVPARASAISVLPHTPLSQSNRTGLRDKL